jgi:phosphoribosylformylglycinamidine (FGAM) synthase-like enzyme
VKGTGRALALAIDGPGPARVGALDPYLAGVTAVVEGALNVACSGATPIGITDCLNFGSPETDLGAWQLERAIDGIAEACRVLDLPVVSGNVSLYNETPDGPILPTPVVGTVGVLEDRASALRMHWAPGEEIWLLGESTADAAALAGSEHAWRRGLHGGVPTLDLAAAASVIRLLPALARRGTIQAAHDCSTGGMVVALARMAIAGGAGLRADVKAADESATAAAFGERAGRVLVGVPAGRAHELASAARLAGVAAVRLGVAGGPALEMRIGSARIAVAVPQLATAWRTGF